MDQDNPFASSYIREGATRIQKPRLSLRQATADTDSSRKWPLPHLRLQQRRLPSPSGAPAASNKPAVSAEGEPDVTASNTSNTRMDDNSSHNQRSSAMSDQTGRSVQPCQVGSVRGPTNPVPSTRISNRRRVVRPADHSRPTVHFTATRPQVHLTTTAPQYCSEDGDWSVPRPERNPEPRLFPMSGEGSVPAFAPMGVPYRGPPYMALPVAPPTPSSTPIPHGPMPRTGPRNIVYSDGYVTISQPSGRSSMYDTTAGSTTPSVGRGSDVLHPSKKMVTFDYSETEDASSCLSISTQATSVDTNSCDDVLTQPKSTTAAINSMPAAPSSSATVVGQTFRRRSRSFGGIDRSLLREEIDFLKAPHRTARSTSKIRNVAVEDVADDATDNDGEDDTSDVTPRFRRAISAIPTPAPVSASQDKSQRAEFEARQVALEAQFEQREQALEDQQTKMADELKDVLASLAVAQREQEKLRKCVARQAERVAALERENDDLRLDLEHKEHGEAEKHEDPEGREENKCQNGQDEDHDEASEELRSDLETATTELAHIRGNLTNVGMELTIANAALTESRQALAEAQEALSTEQEKADLFRRGKEVFETQCTDLNARCSALEAEVVAARDANRELHVLMASQIDNLTQTKVALQSRIEPLEMQLVDREAETANLTAARDALQAEKETAAMALAAAAAAALEASESYKAAIDNAAREMQTRDDTVEALRKDKRDIEDQVMRLEDSCTATTTARDALASEQHEWVTKAADLETQNKQLQADIEGLSADLDAKASEVRIVSDRLAILQDEYAAFKEREARRAAAVEEARLQATEDATAEHRAAVAQLEADKAALVAARDEFRAAAENASDNSATAGVQAEQLQQAQDGATARDIHPVADESTAFANAQFAAELASMREHNERLAAALTDATTQAEHLRGAYNTSEAEGIALRDQLAKMRTRLHGTSSLLAASVSAASTSSSRKGKKSKDELVIVRNSTDSGRFQVMRKSELYSSRSPSRSSHKTDYDSA